MVNKWIEEKEAIRLCYDEGDLLVSKEDFNRAFGAIVNASYDDVKRDFAIKEEKSLVSSVENLIEDAKNESAKTETSSEKEKEHVLE